MVGVEQLKGERLRLLGKGAGFLGDQAMGTHRLSKSAFKIGRSCPTKLYYYRSKYKSLLKENPYLEFLADGGYIVGMLARLLHEDGVAIVEGADQEAAVAQTEEELKKENVTLFEAALRSGNKLVRVDILQKRGKTVKLIEVKSKAFDSDEEHEYKSEGKRTTFTKGDGDIDPDWRPYLEDVCYQAYVTSLAHPEFEVIPYLFLPDKALTTSVDGLGGMFRIEQQPNDGRGGRSVSVEFIGDDGAKAALRKSHFMVLLNVEQEVERLWDEVREAAEELDGSLTPELKKIESPLGRHCAHCEYRVKGEESSGFRECWGSCADEDPHIFDLYYGTDIERGAVYDGLIAQRKASLFDVPTDVLSDAKARGRRQLIQINNTRAGKEWLSPELPKLLEGAKYPLHFIDFETSRVAVPYHAGMRPYEQVAFQWSCHTVKEPGAAPDHFEWINTKESFPNFEFARTLRKQIGDSGSVLTWAHHEASVLRDIVTQVRKYREDDLELAEWMAELSAKDGTRIIDLNKETLRHYFHPEMKGKTSLKAVLPAVWNNNRDLHEIPWLKDYVAYDPDGGKVLDPYKTLQEIEIAGQAEAIREGTGAMRAYQHMLYGSGRDAPEEVKAKWVKLLLRYCKLDTIAMLVVWSHWERRLGLAG